MRRIGPGRPPTLYKPKKKTYLIPRDLSNAFRDAMDGLPSHFLSGAMIFMMAAPRTMRLELIELAQTLPPEKAVKEAKRRLPIWLAQMRGQRQSLKQRTRVIAEATGKEEAPGRR